MREPIQNSNTNTADGSIPGQDAGIPPGRVKADWQRYTVDSLLAIAGVALITGVIATVHLYPRLPSIVLTYLLVIIALASIRGSYAAVLAALLASFSFDFFFTPPLYQFAFTDLTADDLFDPWVFLGTAIIVGQFTVVLRERAEQARRRERETHLLSEQAQEIAALQERQGLARELHDSVLQSLYGISLGVRTALEALGSDPGEAVAPLEYIIGLNEAALDEMRALIFELRPESLVSEGLIAALARQVDALRTRYKLSVNADLGDEPMLSPQKKHGLYRIAQEALHNVVKHAHARTVLLLLSRQGRELLLEVCDDGKGFDPTGPFPGHLGLGSIRERTAQLGGTCSIESAPAQGTCLRVRIPV